MNSQIQVRFKDDDLKAVYSNMVQINCAKEEVVLTFFGVFPPTGNLLARIAMNPAHAKRLLAVLSENLKKYEEQFGKVVPAEEKKIGFRPN